MRKVALVNTIVIVVCVLAVVGWCEYRSRAIAERIVKQANAKGLAFWRTQLSPIYRQADIKHKEHPVTRAEVFGPLMRLLTPLQGNRESPPISQGKDPQRRPRTRPGRQLPGSLQQHLAESSGHGTGHPPHIRCQEKRTPPGL